MLEAELIEGRTRAREELQAQNQRWELKFEEQEQMIRRLEKCGRLLEAITRRTGAH